MSEPTRDVVAIGEALVAFVGEPTGPLVEARAFTPHVVGAESNVAIGLARLGHRVAFVGSVGEDELGEMILRRLRAEGVDVAEVRVADAPTGILVRNLRHDAAPGVLYRRSASAGAGLSREDVEGGLASLRSGGFAHVSAVTPALSQSARDAFRAVGAAARAGRCRLSLDLNYRARLWPIDAYAAELRGAIDGASLVCATAREASIITGSDEADAPRRLVDLGAQLVVVRHGVAGATVVGRDLDAPFEVDGKALAHVVDPVGAGDGFCAGLLSGLIDGLEIADALRRAHRCGAAVAACVGDVTGALWRSELELSDGEVRR